MRTGSEQYEVISEMRGKRGKAPAVVLHLLRARCGQVPQPVGAGVRAMDDEAVLAAPLPRQRRRRDLMR
jgi:hypothetical protein